MIALLLRFLDCPGNPAIRVPRETLRAEAVVCMGG